MQKRSVISPPLHEEEFDQMIFVALKVVRQVEDMFFQVGKEKIEKSNKKLKKFSDGVFFDKYHLFPRAYLVG